MRAMKNKRYVEGKRLESEKQKERILELELRVEELEEENRALTEAVNVLEQSRALQEQVVAEQENRLKELELENKEETRERRFAELEGRMQELEAVVNYEREKSGMWELLNDITEQENEVLKKDLIEQAKIVKDLGQHETNKIIVNNLRALVKDLPKQSAIRKPLLAGVCKSLKEDKIQEIFGVSRAGTTRLRGISSQLLNKYKAGKGVEHKNTALGIRHAEMITILDNIMPVVSGRDYRIRTCAISVLYERYRKQCQHRPLSYNYFRTFIHSLKNTRTRNALQKM